MLPPTPVMPVADAGTGVVPAPAQGVPGPEAAAHGAEFAKVLNAVKEDPATSGEATTGEAEEVASSDETQTSAENEAQAGTVLPGIVPEVVVPVVPVDTAAAAVEVAVAGLNLTPPSAELSTAVVTEITNAVVEGIPAAIEGIVTEGTALVGVPSDAATPVAIPADATAPVSTTPGGAPIDVSTGEPVAENDFTARLEAQLGTTTPATTDAPVEETVVTPIMTEELLPLTDSAEPMTSVGESQTKTALDAMASASKTAESATTTTRPTTGTAGPAPMAEPYRQVVNIVNPLRQLTDGDYRMTLQLHPEHLGRVEVAVSLAGGQISMQLSADNASSRQMLKDSINQLRASLESSGLSTGSLDVGAGNGGQQQQSGFGPGGAARLPEGWTEADNDNFFNRIANVVTEPSVTDGRLDARL